MLPAKAAREGSAAAEDPGADPASADAGSAAPEGDESEGAVARPVRIGGPWCAATGAFTPAESR